MPLVLGHLRHRFGTCAAVQACDHAKRHVGARGDAGSGHERAVLDPARLLDPIDLLALAARELEEDLVRRRAPAVEQPRAREQRGSRAHRHRHLGRARARAQELVQRVVAELSERADPARQEQQVQLGAVAEAPSRNRLGPLRRTHRTRLLRDRLDPQLRAEAAEHLERSVEVEQLEVGIQDGTEGADAGGRGHVRLLLESEDTARIGSDARVRNDDDPADPAILSVGIFTSVTPQIVLYSPRAMPFTEKVGRGLRVKKLPFELVEPRSPEDYRRLSPETGLLPVLEVGGAPRLPRRALPRSAAALARPARGARTAAARTLDRRDVPVLHPALGPEARRRDGAAQGAP